MANSAKRLSCLAAAAAATATSITRTSFSSGGTVAFAPILFSPSRSSVWSSRPLNSHSKLFHSRISPLAAHRLFSTQRSHFGGQDGHSSHQSDLSEQEQMKEYFRKRQGHSLSRETKNFFDELIQGRRMDEEAIEEEKAIEARVRKWLNEIVVGLNLCPFAERSVRGFHTPSSFATVRRKAAVDLDAVVDEHEDDKDDEFESQPVPLLHINVVRGSDPQNVLRWISFELMHRAQFPGTTLVVCPECFATDFERFLGIVEMADEELIKDGGLDGTLQIAPFHPNFCFEGSDPDGVDNWTNRSPYPIFHILREDEVALAVEQIDGDAGRVWKRNVNLLHALADEMGPSALERLYQGEQNEEERTQLQKLLRRFRVQMASNKHNEGEQNIGNSGS